MPENARRIAHVLINAASQSNNKSIAEGAAILALLLNGGPDHAAPAHPSRSEQDARVANNLDEPQEGRAAAPARESDPRRIRSQPGERLDPPPQASKPQDAEVRAALQDENLRHQTRMAIIRNIR
jgi:hypothetical protein